MLIGNNRGGLTGYKTTFNVDGTTPIQNLDNPFVISLYPNPVKDVLTVDIKNTSNVQFVTLRVFNAVGQVVKTINAPSFNMSPLGQYQINTQDLKSGMYFISVETNDNKSIVKFVKE
jgi:hypothetical protein